MDKVGPRPFGPYSWPADSERSVTTDLLKCSGGRQESHMSLSGIQLGSHTHLFVAQLGDVLGIHLKQG